MDVGKGPCQTDPPRHGIDLPPSLSRPERAILRRNGPAIPPARVVGPGGMPPTHRPAQRANRSSNHAGHERNCWPVGPALWAGSAFTRGASQTVGPAGPQLGPDRPGLAWSVFSGPERAVVRPKGPAIPPARVVGPGSASRQHTVRPNGPTVPPTARATRRIVGPLGRLGRHPAQPFNPKHIVRQSRSHVGGTIHGILTGTFSCDGVRPGFSNIRRLFPDSID